jgi:hypothetical protein
MPELASAALLEDGGAAASSSDDLFRHPGFLAAEGTTHTLRIEGEGRTTLIPLVVREIPGAEGLDAISPYGYPGALVVGEGAPPEPAVTDWSATGLVAAFVRDRLGQPSLGGATERSRVQIHDPARPRAIRPRLAEQARANERAGWRVETVPGPEAAGADRDAFALAYEETMRRTGAPERYLFGRAYYDAVLEFPRSWLLLARDPEGDPGAAAIAAISDGYLHYFLGGTGDRALEASPFKNAVLAMLDLADELALPLNLGGGVAPGDGLERFKRGFANRDEPFFAHEIVCDPAAYDLLSAGRAGGGYFPAYRAA